MQFFQKIRAKPLTMQFSFLNFIRIHTIYAFICWLVKSILCAFLAFSLLRSSPLNGSTEQDKMKLLILIIATDDFPGSDLVFPYRELQNIWRSYMHLDPKHIEAYFIRANPNLTADFEVINDVLWSKTEENLKPGILNKTILSLQYFLPRLQEFDFILRTNLSSFYVLPQLMKFIKTLPKTKTYCASGEQFGSGCGYLLSNDLAALIVEHKDRLLNNLGDDDVCIGYFLRDFGIPLLPAPRKDLLCLEDWMNYRIAPNPHDFHFRIKNLSHNLRLTDDLFIFSELIKKYYNISVRIKNKRK